MNIFFVVIIGILSSLSASIIFLYFIGVVLRPKILISDKIVKNEKGFFIKIINKTRWPVHDIEVKTFLIRTRIVPGGMIYPQATLDVSKPKIFSLDKYKKNDIYGGYAFRFQIIHNLEEISDQNITFLRFSVYARHSLSGLGKVFVNEYKTINDCIRQGNFKFGKTFEII